jgi:serine acetyltransferase
MAMTTSKVMWIKQRKQQRPQCSTLLKSFLCYSVHFYFILVQLPHGLIKIHYYYRLLLSNPPLNLMICVTNYLTVLAVFS